MVNWLQKISSGNEFHARKEKMMQCVPQIEKSYNVNENLLIALMHNFKRNSELLVANALKG